MAELTPSLIAELERIVGPANVFWRDNDLISYSYDGSIDRGRPNAVVLPGSADEVVAIVKAAQRHDLPIVARGAGTAYLAAPSRTKGSCSASPPDAAHPGGGYR